MIAAEGPVRGEGSSESAGAERPRTRSTATSLRGSKATACASSPGWRPRSSTRVSVWPATTCALVTTKPSPATQPEPSTPSPQAEPSTLTTLSAAAFTAAARAIEAVGARTLASGPSMRGNGSSRASASISPFDGGSSAFRRCRIAERWTSCRASPPLASASAPSTQAIPMPTHAVSTEPRKPSTVLIAGLRTRPRKRAPTPSKPTAKTIPAISAPIKPKAGAHGEWRPPESTSGPIRVPSHAPAAKPISASAPATNPWAQPNRPSRTTMPTISQSTPVTCTERTEALVESSKLTGRRPIADPRRFAPLAAAAALALVAGLITGARHVPPERRTIAAFTHAWERGDRHAMYALLSDAARRRTSYARFDRAYRDAAATLTLRRVRAGSIGGDDTVPLTFDTTIFGKLRGTLALPTGERKDQDPGVDWREPLVYPGLRPGEQLRRETRLPARATIEARDGTATAKGRERLSELGPIAAEIAGRIGPAPPERRQELAARGIPPDAAVGLTGLEREFDERLAGTPG